LKQFQDFDVPVAETFAFSYHHHNYAPEPIIAHPFYETIIHEHPFHVKGKFKTRFRRRAMNDVQGLFTKFFRFTQ